MSYGLSGKKLGGIFGFRAKHMVSYAENLNLLYEDLDSYVKGGFFSVVIAENEAAAKNICGILCERGISALVESDNGEFSAEDLPKNTLLVGWKNQVKGYELTTPRVAVLSTVPENREGAYSASSKLKRKKKKKHHCL